MIPQMFVHWLNIRLFLTISVALFRATILFLAFSRTSRLPFYQLANGPFLSDGNPLQHVFNQTLGVSIDSTVAGSRHPVIL